MAETSVPVEQNIQEVRERIRAAEKRAGREPGSVKLICVTKTKPVPLLEEAYQAGERIFGENRVQEILAKKPLLPEDVSWHMIGHLQTNKVKQVVGNAAMIHSVDSLRLAQEISRRAQEAGLIVPVLIEVNAAGEESKYGVRFEDTEALIREIAPLPGLIVRGLMTVAPYTEDPETSRPYFSRLRQLSIDIAAKNIDNTDIYELSMGMSGDFEVAVEEGATFVRVGTGIFGERHYPQ